MGKHSNKDSTLKDYMSKYQQILSLNYAYYGRLYVEFIVFLKGLKWIASCFNICPNVYTQGFSVYMYSEEKKNLSRKLICQYK